MSEKTTLLIDADIIAYKFASGAQESFEWGDGIKSVQTESIDAVLPRVDAELAYLKELLEADDLIICLSCPHEENFRLSILPSYKGNRDYSNRPLLLSPIKSYLAENYRSYSRPTLEADDVMGILSTAEEIIPGRRIIVSEDKDMKSIPGWLFNPRKDSKPKLIGQREADHWHLYQTLIGDATDNYKGCPGIGPDKAETLLAGPIKLVPYEHTFKAGPRKGAAEVRYRRELAETQWEAIVSHFAAQELTEEDALVQARVARICRASDYDFKAKEVRLWSPR